jgi:hypothetical protein
MKSNLPFGKLLCEAVGVISEGNCSGFVLHIHFGHFSFQICQKSKLLLFEVPPIESGCKVCGLESG